MVHLVLDMCLEMLQGGTCAAEPVHRRTGGPIHRTGAFAAGMAMPPSDNGGIGI